MKEELYAVMLDLYGGWSHYVLGKCHDDEMNIAVIHF